MVTSIALQGVGGGLHHVSGGPVHVRGGEAVLTAVLQAGELGGDFERIVPIEVGPEAIFAGGNRLK